MPSDLLRDRSVPATPDGSNDTSHPADIPRVDASALPVAMLGGGPQAEAVRRWTEGVLGWQSVDPADDQLVPAAVQLRDLDSREPPADEVPSVLLVDDDATGERVARVAADLAPDAVLGWPSGRDRLGDVVTEVLERRRPAVSTRGLRIGGSAGGVGTTTVTLALGGLAAWAGSPTLAVLRGTALPFRGMPAAALSAPDLWSRADAAVGVPSLHAVVVADGGEPPELTDRSIGASLFDLGADPDVDVLVCRPDAAGLAALARTTAAVIVLVGEGPAGERDLRRASGGRRIVMLPWSARVARAGLQGRVPAGVPGAWLTRLRPLLPRSATAELGTPGQMSTGDRRSRRRRRGPG